MRVRYALCTYVTDVSHTYYKELLLVEGLEMFGMGNWEQISEHIGTKTRIEVAEHYESVYVNSDAWPLPVGRFSYTYVKT